jgi:hypothetical protein
MPPAAQRKADSPSSARRTARDCRLTGCDEPSVALRYCDAHLRERAPAEWAKVNKLVGKETPRLFTPPLRPLTRKTSDGFAVIDFAEMIGEPLLPWQKWTVIHALEKLPDGSYRFRVILILVGRQNGKSTLKRTVSLWRMYMNPRSRILGVAQDCSLARDQWNMCQETIHDCPDLEAEWGKVRNVNGDEYFWAGEGDRYTAKSRYVIKAANRKAGRGGSNDEVNIDELREQQDWKAWAALSKTTQARANGQIWAMSNAGDDQSVVLNQLLDTARAGRDPSLFFAEYSGPDNCELDDRAAIAQANPGLGHTVSFAAIMSSLSTDPPGIYRTEVLCQRVDQLDGAVDLLAWKACADPAGTMDALKDRIGACFDVAPDGLHATLAVAGKRDDGRVRVEIVKAWKDIETCRAELGPELDKIKPRAIAWYPTGPGAGFASILKGRDGEMPLTGMEVATCCQQLADMALAREIVQPADPLLDAHIGGARKLPSGDGWRFTRRGEAGHVDAAYAAAGAVQAALTMPEPVVQGLRVLRW